MRKLSRYLFFILFTTLGVTFFTRNNFRSVMEIRPEVLKEPRQEELADRSVIRFIRNGYAYELTPVFSYDISALIVSKLDYGWFTVYKSDKSFFTDLCLIWGSNAASGIFKASPISYSQDCRWCYVQWSRPVEDFNANELSNDHLLARDRKLEKKIEGFAVGDQVRLRGKLVDVKAHLTGKAGNYDASDISWKTSVIRTDRGAGACEVFYVEDAEILKKGNPLSHFLFGFSFYGLILLIVSNIFCFVREIIGLSREPGFEGKP